MIRTLPTLALAAAGALALTFTSCKDDAYADTRTSPEGVQEQTEQQWEAAKDGAERRLKDLKTRYEELEDAAEKKGEAALARFNELKMDLEPKLQRAEAQVEQLKDQSKSAWREASAKAEKALSEVSDGIQNAWDKAINDK